MTVATMLRKPRRAEFESPAATTARPPAHAEAPDQGVLHRVEAPETRVARHTEAPDAGDGRAGLIDAEFTHGRSRS